VSDQVDEAIAASAPGRPVEAVTLTVTVSSGRQVGLLVPSDLSRRETLDLVGFLAEGLEVELERRRTPRPRLFVPGHAIPRA
jgi:hypothetical protein